MTEDQWLALLTRSHQVIVRAELWHNGQLLPKQPVILSGSVSVDGKAAIRRQFSGELAVKRGSLMPTTPGITELRLFRGIRHRGEEKYWPLGRFRISKDDVHQTRQGLTYKVDCYDISRYLTLNKLTQPFSIPAGMPAERAIELLLSKALTGLTFVFPSGSIGNTPAMVFEDGTEPWTSALKIATQFGYELYIDVEGRVICRYPERFDAPTLRTYTPRELFEVRNVRSDDPGYNGIKVISAPTDGPAVFAFVWDDSRGDYDYRGPYGQRARRYSTTFPMSQLQVNRAAQSRFAVDVGITTQANFETFVDPSLEANTVILVEAPDVNLSGRQVAESFSIDLADLNANMAVSTSKRIGGVIATEADFE